ncbi:DUF2652 domain-containing protein [Pyxidicoccus trucidator]|uniref:DUF2652 domain-containing protein n=1 Tax=Pyxidicoccus trucidator TaxID=2709662 RepID=UPI0013DC66E2|nr:DUF2652 domain-containing protein [Pyxidicoccus trucidator]
MAIQRSILLIADIGGYTRFMRTHRMSLAHAQEVVATLLEAVIDASRPLKLAKLEGDAAFLYVPLESEAQLASVGQTVADIRRAFLARQQDIVANRLCTCHGCMEVESLNLKFVAHVGDVAFQKVKRHKELAGMDVILLHRMLKNEVPAREYLLMTDELLGSLEPTLGRSARALLHDFEGIGPTQTHYIDLAELAADLPPALVKSLPVRWWDRIVMNVKVLHYYFGIKEPCQDFRNVEKT